VGILVVLVLADAPAIPSLAERRQLGEGQKLFESLGRGPASTRVKSELNNFPFTVIDPATLLDEKDKWEKVWNDFFLKK